MDTLYQHQKNLIEKLPKRHILIHEMGTGKTRTAIEMAKKVGGKAIVVCPKGLQENWKQELKKWECKVPTYVIHKERFKKLWDELPQCDSLIIDECHFFAGMKSAMSKSLISYVKKQNPKYMWGLSGTVYRSTPWDIYRLCEIFGYKPYSYYAFDKAYFYHVPMGGRFVPMVKPGIKNDLANMARKIGSVVRMDECADVPEQNFVTEYFNYTKEQLKAIDNIIDILPIVRFTKIHQICGGTLKGDEYEPDQIIKSDKKDRLMEVLTDNDKAIVVCRYRNEMSVLHKEIKDTFKDKTVEIINGDTPAEDRHKILERLNNRDNYTLIVSSSCSEGWQLKKCPLMVFYSYDFALKNYLQMKARIQRIDNLKTNTYLSLIVKDSIDEDIFKTITEDKMDFHIAIMNEKTRSGIHN